MEIVNFLARMGNNGGQQKGGPVAQERVHPPFRPSIHKDTRSSPADSVCSIEPNNSVSGQGKTENTGRHGSRTCEEGVQELYTCEYDFFSRVFLVPKQLGGWRLVIDPRTLNEYLTKMTFSMDTLMHIKEAAHQGTWAASLDFSDAYHRVPIHPDSQIYLCFQVGDERFRYMVLPFGLSTAPWVFTDVVKQEKVWSVAQLRVLFQYMDDCLNRCLDNSHLSQVAPETGRTSLDKSYLGPRQVVPETLDRSCLIVRA